MLSTVRPQAWMILLGTIAFTACASNPYSQFYVDRAQSGRSIPASPSETIQVLHGNDPDQDFVSMAENGFALLGFANFNGPAARVGQALDQGQRVGATIVVLYGKYTGTVTGSVPIVLPNQPITATTSEHGIVSGPGGTAVYSGTAVTTISGGSTAYNIPYRVDRYDQFASFWAKAKPPILGVYSRDLDQAERSALQRNRGVVVTAVVKGSPAFASDILRGDILLQVEGTEVLDVNQMNSLLLANAGRRVVIQVMRSGAITALNVQLNAAPQ
jgi:S1-C subfamily serine protease